MARKATKSTKADAKKDDKKITKPTKQVTKQSLGRREPAKPAKPTDPKIDTHAIGAEFDQALKDAGIDLTVKGSASGANLSKFLQVIAEFISKYGTAILPLLQMLFSVLSHGTAEPAPVPQSAPTQATPAAENAGDTLQAAPEYFNAPMAEDSTEWENKDGGQNQDGGLPPTNAPL